MDEDQSEKIVREELVQEEKIVPLVEPVQGEKVSEESMIDRLEKAVAKAEAANKVTAELLERQERAKVKAILGGRSSVGHATVLSADEKKDADAREFLKGTGFDEELFPSVNKN